MLPCWLTKCSGTAHRHGWSTQVCWCGVVLVHVCWHTFPRGLRSTADVCTAHLPPKALPVEASCQRIQKQARQAHVAPGVVTYVPAWVVAPKDQLGYQRCLGFALHSLHMSSDISTPAVVVPCAAGWVGGSCGRSGQRIPLGYTRAIIDAIQGGQLQAATHATTPYFNLQVSAACRHYIGHRARAICRHSSARLYC